MVCIRLVTGPSYRYRAICSSLVDYVFPQIYRVSSPIVAWKRIIRL